MKTSRGNEGRKHRKEESSTKLFKKRKRASGKNISREKMCKEGKMSGPKCPFVKTKGTQATAMERKMKN